MPHRVSEAEYRRLAKQPEPVKAPRVAAKPETSGSGRVAASSPRTAPGRSSSKGDNYWGFGLTMIGVLLIAYLAGKGQLTTLINILIPQASNAPQFGGKDTKPGGSYATGAGVDESSKGGGPAANIIPMDKNNPFSSTFDKFMNKQGVDTNKPGTANVFPQNIGVGDLWDYTKKGIGAVGGFLGF